MRGIGVLIVLLVLVTEHSIAQTNVSGNVSGVWDLEGSPYILVDVTSIANNQSLRIEPGVVVQSSNNIPLVIHGNLHAAGTVRDSIYFEVVEENASWGGLRFFRADSSRLEYCVVTDGLNMAGEGRGDLVSSGGNILIQYGDVTIEHSRISNGRASGFGGGIAIWEASPVISNCLINNNHSQQCGGGIEAYLRSFPIISDCRFTGNVTGWDGGGLCIEDNSNARVERCVFIDNDAAVGGGIGMNASSAVIDHCTFTENTGLYGGGIFISAGSDIIIEWCDFYSNTAGMGGGGYGSRFEAETEVRYCRFIGNNAVEGGALTVMNQPVCNIHHNLFVSNTARLGGAFASNERRPMGETPLLMTNCTFINNSSEEPDREPSIAFLRGNDRLNLSSCIIWGGSRPLFNNPNMISVTYSHVEGNFNGQGNSADNPGLFIIDTTWCLLRGDSPCKNSGDLNLPDDPDNTRNDRGWMHFPGDVLEGLSTDTLSMELRTDERRPAKFEFRNGTSAPIFVTPVESCREGIQLEIVDVSAITNDYEIHGVAYTDAGYFLSGGNNGEDPNQIYQLNEEFELVNQFDQPGGSDGDGFLDLGSGGDHLIYGGDSEKIVEFSTQGELGEQYFDPAGFNCYQALGVDLVFTEGEVDVYFGGEEGIIICGDDEMWELDRFDIGFGVTALGVKGNTRALYLVSETIFSIYILSLLTTGDGQITPLFELSPPGAGYSPGGFGITQNLHQGYGTIVGVWEGEGHTPDRLFKYDLYTSWLIPRSDVRLLKPGEESDWEIVFAGDQVPEGVHNSEYYIAINGWSSERELPAQMVSRDMSVSDKELLYPSTPQLFPVFPNPFNSTTAITYGIPIQSNISLKLYDLSGRLIQTLVEGEKHAGIHACVLSAQNLSSSLFFVSFEAVGQLSTRKVMLIK